MTKEKLKGYESPTMDVLELKVEGVVCTSGYGAPGAAGLLFVDGDNINDYTDFDF